MNKNYRYSFAVFGKIVLVMDKIANQKPKILNKNYW
jgi:hypothetical protein